MRCIVFDCEFAWGVFQAESRYASALERLEAPPEDDCAPDPLGNIGMFTRIGMGLPSSRPSGASVCIESVGIDGVEDIGGAVGAGGFARSAADC